MIRNFFPYCCEEDIMLSYHRQMHVYTLPIKKMTVVISKYCPLGGRHFLSISTSVQLYLQNISFCAVVKTGLKTPKMFHSLTGSCSLVHSKHREMIHYDDVDS